MITPPPPPPTQRPVLVPIPNGVDPQSAAPARDATIAAWIAGPVRGHDNRMAAMRRVAITGTEGAYTITIDNQFRFRCGLELDATGQPSALRDCRSPEPDWHARPDVIAVTCTTDDAGIECQAPYELVGHSGYSSREIMLFRRRR